MPIFQKQEIKVGDLVIGLNKYGFDAKGAAMLQRYFDVPSLVLEIKGSEALVFFENQGATWYNLTKLERVYVTEEFTDADRRGLAPVEFNNSDQSGNKDDC